MTVGELKEKLKIYQNDVEVIVDYDKGVGWWNIENTTTEVLENKEHVFNLVTNNEA